jgi:hypothetical protein
LFVVSSEIVNELYTLDRILLAIEFFEYLLQVLCNAFVTDQIAHADFPVSIVVEQTQMAEVVALDIGILDEGATLEDAVIECVVDGLNSKAWVR